MYEGNLKIKCPACYKNKNANCPLCHGTREVAPDDIPMDPETGKPIIPKQN